MFFLFICPFAYLPFAHFGGLYFFFPFLAGSSVAWAAFRFSRSQRTRMADTCPSSSGDMWLRTKMFMSLSMFMSCSAGTPKTGFYGLDLYSLHTSIAAVLDYLDRVDPDGAVRARARYACFDHFGDDPQVYGYATTMGIAEPCENEAVGQLVEMQRRAGELTAGGGERAVDELFFATQNARLARNAESYYRAMFAGRIPSWNLRDRHMAETLEALAAYIEIVMSSPELEPPCPSGQRTARRIPAHVSRSSVDHPVADVSPARQRVSPGERPET